MNLILQKHDIQDQNSDIYGKLANIDIEETSTSKVKTLISVAYDIEESFDIEGQNMDRLAAQHCRLYGTQIAVKVIFCTRCAAIAQFQPQASLPPSPRLSTPRLTLASSPMANVDLPHPGQYGIGLELWQGLFPPSPHQTPLQSPGCHRGQQQTLVLPVRIFPGLAVRHTN
jgi:hypothetical protein